MLFDWLAEGYPAALFWSSTLKEIDLHMRAAAERFRRAHNADALLAWNIFTLEHAKGHKSLSALQIPERSTKQDQTWREQLATAQQWFAGRKKR